MFIFRRKQRIKVTTFISHFRIVLIVVSLCITALSSIPSMNVDPTPLSTTTQLSVQCILLNASPESVETGITSRLEDMLAQLPDLKRISSVSGYGESVVDLTFGETTHMSIRLFEIQGILRRIYPQLPSGSSFPQILPYGNDEKPLLTYAVTGGNHTAFQEENMRSDLFRLCSGIEGVSRVEVAGGRQQRLTVSVDKRRCISYRLDSDSLATIIKQAIRTRFAGEIETETGCRYSLWIRGSSGITAISNILVSARSGGLVRVKDVAKVEVTQTANDKYYSITGMDAMALLIYSHRGINTIVLARTIRNALDRYVAQTGSCNSMLLQSDASEPLSAELALNYQRLAIAIGVFSGFLLLFSGGVKNAIVLLLSLTANLCITLLLTFLLHIPIQTGSIIGFSVSFGLTSDNTLVMMDHYARTGNRKIIGALMISTLTTLSGLLFFYLLFRDQRPDLGAFCTIISFALIASFVVCYSFVPSIHHLLKDRRGSRRDQMRKLRARSGRARSLYFTWLSRLALKRKWLIAGLVVLFGVPLHLLPSTWPGHSWYNETFGSDFYQDKVAPMTNTLVGGAFDFFIRNSHSRPGTGVPGDTVLNVRCSLSPNARQGSVNEVLRQLEIQLDTLAIIERTTLTIDNRQEGEIAIHIMHRYVNTILPYYLKDRLITRALHMSGVTWTISGFGHVYTTAVENPLPHFRIAMDGYNYTALKGFEQALADTLINYSRISNVRIDYERSNSYGNNTNYELSVDRLAAGYNGLTERRLSDESAFLVGQKAEIGNAEVNGHLYPILIRDIRSDSMSKYLLMNERLQGPLGRYVKPSSVSDLCPISIPNVIRKEGRQYICTLQLDYVGSPLFGRKLIDNKLNDLRTRMPIGFSATMLSDGEWGWGGGTVRYDLLIMYVCMFYILCGILFENLIQPLYILVMILVAYIGIFLSPALTGFHFGDGGYSAFLMVGGLAVSTSIFIFSDLNTARSKNRNCVIVAVLTRRSKVILFTTFSACSSFIPFLLEQNNGSFWFTFAVSTITGLITMLLGIFMLLPVFLWKLDRPGNRRSGFNKFRLNRLLKRID